MKNTKLLLKQILDYANAHPQKTALKFLEADYQTSQEITYAELAKRVQTLAKILVSIDNRLIQKPILLLFDSSINYVVSFLSVLYSGNIAVTAYPPRQERHLQRLLKIIEDCQAPIILTTKKVRDFCDQNKFQFPIETTLVCVDALDSAYPDQGDTQIVEIQPNYIAFLQYTSGSTGAPKGVIVTHQNIVANLNVLVDALGREIIEKCVSWLPIFHDMGLIGNTLLPLFHGGTCVFMEPLTFLKNPFFWLQAISKERGTYTMAPNFAYDLAIEAFQSKDPASIDLDFTAAKALVNGAEPVRAETIRRFETALHAYHLAEGIVKPGYGMAETTLCISVETGEKRFFTAFKSDLNKGFINRTKCSTKENDQTELVRCGKVNDYVLRIVHPQSQRVLPVNTIGEIWVQGSSVAAGYYQNAEKTKEIFQAFTANEEGPFLRTGDLGVIDEEGALTICGRVKDLIIINGRNVYPQDVEAACYLSDAALICNSAAAFSINDNAEECILIAEVTEHLTPGKYQQIMLQIKKTVFEHTDVSLSDILLIPPRKILKTSSGKIQRSACKQAYLNKSFPVVAQFQKYATPTQDRMETSHGETNISTWLKQWVANKTKIPLEQVKTDRAFAEFGLNSVQLVSMISELEQVAKQSLDPWLAWEFPTIHALNEKLTQVNVNEVTETKGHYEPIAIIGMDCRFPGKHYEDIEGLDNFWSSLQKTEDSIEPIPEERWDNRLYYDPDPNKKGHMYSSGGSFLSDIKRFDNKFFNISPREAEYLDPQQRLVLMTTWHALEDAGLVEEKLKNSKTGIYLGISTHDYDQLIQKQIPLEALGTYQATGTSFATAAGRIAYFLGTQGPCMAIDTACSSSLVSIHQASRALQDGDCQLAIAGGVNLILSPEGNIIFCNSGMLSPKNRCSTFDRDADGYVRGEGCGIVILKKLSDALRDGDKIEAVIYASAVNQDGASNGLTAPNLSAQIDVIKTALNLANLKPEQVTHVEAHGTGTALGDPIEWEGIRRSYALERQKPLYITSLKTRIGHLEAAAGVAGLIKTALAIKHGKIPAHLHLKEFNPKLHQQENMIVPTQLQNWDEKERYAGISSFGFSGTNAHIILGHLPSQPEQETINRPQHLWVISAKDSASLHQYLHNYRAYGERKPNLHFPSLCHYALTARTHFPRRAFIVAADENNWLQALKEEQWQEGLIAENNSLAWLFTGQGCLYPNMAAELYRFAPEFAAIIEQCCAIAQQWLPYDIRAVLLATPKSIEVNHTLYAQPALFIYEYALAQWYLLLGLKPTLLLGHSLGEYVAACIAHIMSLKDALYLVCQRAVLLSSLPDEGSMLAINASSTVVESLIAPIEDLVISVKNGPEQTVVSGTHKAISLCEKYCFEQNIRSKKVATSHAFHSPLMQPIAKDFAKIAAQIDYKPAQIPVISNVTGHILNDGQVNAEYWCQHLLQTVEFQQGLHTLVNQRIEICQEIGPKPILIALAQTVHDFMLLPSVGPNENPWLGIMETLGMFYLRGIDINWHALDKHARFVHEDLLNYPFGGKEYWLPKTIQTHSPHEEAWKTALYHQQWTKLAPDQQFISLEEKTVVLISHQEHESYHWISCHQLHCLNAKSLEQSWEVLKQADWIIYQPSNTPDALIDETLLFKQILHHVQQQVPHSSFLLWCEAGSLTGASLLPLLKSVKEEYPQWRGHYFETVAEENELPLPFMGCTKPDLWALRYEQGEYYKQHIVALAPEKIQDEWSITADTTCLVTGACGDLGQALVESLAHLGARYIIAVGRKEKESPWTHIIQTQQGQGLQITYYSCDVADAEAVAHLMLKIPKNFPPLGVIVHAAGLTQDKPWLATTDEDIKATLNAKALGAWNLHQATLNQPIKAFICISSLSSVLGNAGQAAYAAANGFLNALSLHRQHLNLPAQTLILGPVKNTGLFKKNEQQLTDYLFTKGIVPLSRTEVQTIFQKQIQEPNLIINHFVVSPLQNQVEKTEPENTEINKECTPETVLALAQDILHLSLGELSIQDNWFESGMDSIMATQLVYKINRKYPKARLSSKDVFNYASAEKLSKKINDNIQGNHCTSNATPVAFYAPVHTLPLSLQQQEMWNFIKNNPASPAYQIAVDIEIKGFLSTDKLQHSLSEVLAHHDILRCSFHESLNQTSQHIHEQCPLTMELCASYDDKEAAEFLNAPFDLQKPPLIRTRLICQGQDSYRWLLVVHHLLCDGHTITAFIKEVIDRYEGNHIEDIETQYKDYVTWQWNNVYYTLDKDREFWRSRLQGIPLGVALATDTGLPKEARVIQQKMDLKELRPSMQVLDKNKLSLSNYLLANLFDILLDYFKQEQQGIVVFFSGRENGEFASVFGDTSNDVLIIAHKESHVLTQTQNVQQQIFSLQEKQYLRMPILKEMGLSMPMISFDFQHSSDLNIKSSLKISTIKNGNIQNHLWGDEPRMLSFKVLLKANEIQCGLKYRQDKITDNLAQELLTAWMNKIRDKNQTLQHHEATESIYFKASPLQQNLWTLFQSHPDKMPYYVPLFKEAAADIDLEKLDKALQQTISCHPALQTFFVEKNNELHWAIHSEAQAKVNIMDTEDLFTAIGSLLSVEIPVHEAPLLRLHLIRAPGKNPILLVRLHHLIADGISTEVFFNELVKNYMGKESFSLHDHYLREYQHGQEFYEKNKEDCLSYLEPLNQHLQHYQIDTTPQPKCYMGGVVYQNLGKENSAKISSFCKKHNISPYAFYFHMFCTLLSKMFDQNRIYISMVKSNRVKLPDPDLIGYYADNIPVLWEAPAKAELAQGFKTTQMQVLELIERFQYPMLREDLEKIGYKQPHFIFNQYPLDNNNNPVLRSADYLMEGVLQAGNNQVALWNYHNPEKLNVLILSGGLGDMIGLVFHPNFCTVAQADDLLQKFVAMIQKELDNYSG